MTQTENKLEIHIHEGGQLNLAMDESNINAIQNNSVQQENDIVNSFLETSIASSNLLTSASTS